MVAARTLAYFAACLVLVSCGGPAGTSVNGEPPTPVAPPPIVKRTDVVTYKYNNLRTGVDLTESVLTPANASASTFGLLRNLNVDGKVDAEPLYLAQLLIAGTAHDVVFVATESNSVYAFVAGDGSLLWQTSLTPARETPSDDQGYGQITLTIGVTSTPVIDRSVGPHGAIFVVAMTQDASRSYHERLHALDVTTGEELAGGPK